VEVVNLVLKSKNTPPRTKRVLEGGSEEVTLLLGGRRGERRGESGKKEEGRSRPVLQVREKEEVNLAMARRQEKREKSMGGNQEVEKKEKVMGGIKAAQEVMLVFGKGDEVVSMSISGENQIEVQEIVNIPILGEKERRKGDEGAREGEEGVKEGEEGGQKLSILGENQMEIEEVNLKLSSDLQPEVEEEVTLSLSTDISIDLTQLGKEWTVENVNKYGSVLMTYASQPLLMQVKFQSHRADNWNDTNNENDPMYHDSFYAKFELMKRRGETCELDAVTPEKAAVILPHVVKYTFERHERGINFVLVTIYFGSEEETRELVCCTLVPVVVI